MREDTRILLRNSVNRLIDISTHLSDEYAESKGIKATVKVNSRSVKNIWHPFPPEEGYERDNLAAKRPYLMNVRVTTWSYLELPGYFQSQGATGRLFESIS